jgi:hypothetical protein
MVRVCDCGIRWILCGANDDTAYTATYAGCGASRNAVCHDFDDDAQAQPGDGTMVTASSEDVIARDNAGRWYSDEHPVMGKPESKDIPYRPNVHDPIEHRLIHFVPPDHKVVIYMGSTEAAEPKPPAATTAQRHGANTLKVEALSEQTILGFRAWGQRTTATVVRNGKTTVVLDEFWYSDELGMDLLRRHVDPVSGEEVTAIMDLKRVEPDANLFRIPEGWAREQLGTQ